MHVYIVGGTGAVGSRLVAQLVGRGHRVTATTTTPTKLGQMEGLGADGVVVEGLDAGTVGQAVAMAQPDAVVHEMTRSRDRPQAFRPAVRAHQPALEGGPRPPD